jgi:luciferase family oxidoreductase group 1
MSFKLSVLDQSPIAAGSTAGDALRNSIELARLADRMGYHRYWLAEHHGTPGLACNSPEVMIGPVAAATSRIRVGSGGIMLPHYSPLKVFESFAMLSGLYPGRIDLGLGRAPGTSSRVAHMWRALRCFLPRSLYGFAAAARASCVGVRLGRLRGNARGGRAPLRQRAHDDVAAFPRPADRGAAG